MPILPFRLGGSFVPAEMRPTSTEGVVPLYITDLLLRLGSVLGPIQLAVGSQSNSHIRTPRKIWGPAVRTENLLLIGLRAHSQYAKMAGVNHLLLRRVSNDRHANHRDRLQTRKHLYRTMVSVLPSGLLGNRLGVGERIRNALFEPKRSP